MARGRCRERATALKAAHITSMEDPMTPEREERDREERIRLRALEIWREQGCPDGRAKEHWEQAEREVGGNSGEAGGDQQPTSQSVPAEAAVSPKL